MTPKLQNISEKVVGLARFELLSALQTTFGGGADSAFINKLNSDGSGNAYVTGSTGSVNFPASFNAFRPTCTLTSLAYGSPPSCVSAFVTKLNADGSALLCSTCRA